MEYRYIADKFEEIGVRVRFRENRPFSVNVIRDRKGPIYTLSLDGNVEDIKVIDVKKDISHLLLQADIKGDRNISKLKFLCGFDERGYFAAAVPNESVRSVRTAMDALKPITIREAQEGKVRYKDQIKRKTGAYIRQGEWFFLPQPDFQADEKLILKNEPIRRGRSRAHMCEYLYRTGGETVYVSRRHSSGLTQGEWEHLRKNNLKDFTSQSWRMMRRNMTVLVKGRITAPDHKAIHLTVWHLVVPNAEANAPGMSAVAFLD